MKWFSVTRKEPCPICGKPDWCGRSDIGLVCCMRTEGGNPTKSGNGWIYRIGDIPGIPIQKYKPEKTYITPKEAIRLLSVWKKYTTDERVSELADDIGVSKRVVRKIGAEYSHHNRCWAFPMRDGDGQVIGIRLRNSEKKWAVGGSREGLFFNPELTSRDIVIVEGPTDTLAGLTLGLPTIGRPSCCGGVTLIADLCNRIRVKNVIIIADRDMPGRNGARTLANALESIVESVLVKSLPYKDIREFLNDGGTRMQIKGFLQ